jgi:hypothetical protein
LGDSDKAEETECAMTCSGDADALCGNGDRLSLYMKDDNGETPVGPSTGDYRSLGWYVSAQSPTPSVP